MLNQKGTRGDYGAASRGVQEPARRVGGRLEVQFTLSLAEIEARLAAR